MKRGRTAVALGSALLVVAIHYRDLLASAFASNPFPNSAASAARGKLLYDRHCVVCHGPSGRGDGPAARSMDASMDDLSDLPPPPIFPDGVIVYRIAQGKGLMPAWGKTLTHDELWDVLNHLRALNVKASG